MDAKWWQNLTLPLARWAKKEIKMIKKPTITCVKKVWLVNNDISKCTDSYLKCLSCLALWLCTLNISVSSFFNWPKVMFGNAIVLIGDSVNVKSEWVIVA